MAKKSCRLWVVFLLLVPILFTAGCQSGSGPDVDASWSEWIKANHHEIRSLDTGDADFADLQFFKPLLAGRRLVQLGENGHGVAEFSRAKVRLIKFLHEEMDFDVIAFESNIFECFNADAHATDWTPEEMMGRSIFQVWYTEDVLELFRYIKESKSTSRPLILAGFDVQYSSLGRLRRPDSFQDVIARIDPGYAAEVRRTDMDFLNSFASRSGWPDSQVAGYRLFYDGLRQWFDDHLQELIPFFPQTPLLPLVMRQAAWSQLIQLNEDTTPYEQGGFNLRDLGMADNVEVLMERLYPGKKIMLWAHNLHADYSPNLTRIHEWEMLSMGYWLVQRHRSILYTIGLYMFQGEAAENSGKIYEIAPAPANTLEAILYQTGREFAFVDMLNQQESPGNSWMFSLFHWMNGGIYLETIIPRQQYDGIFYVKTVHPPPYVTYYELQNSGANPAPGWRE